MTVAGTAVVVCSAEVAWAVTLLTPYAGGSGGFLEILAPLFVGVFAAVAGLAALTVLLGTGVLIGLAVAGRSVARRIAALSALLATSALVAWGSRLLAGSGASAWPSPRPALPARFGEWANGTTPASGGGTWRVGRLEADAQPGLIFDFSNGSQAELQLETAGSSLAMYFDRGDPDEGWSGQYRFVKLATANQSKAGAALSCWPGGRGAGRPVT